MYLRILLTATLRIGGLPFRLPSVLHRLDILVDRLKWIFALLLEQLLGNHHAEKHVVVHTLFTKRSKLT